LDFSSSNFNVQGHITYWAALEMLLGRAS
jgi:hypothetical protein